MKEVNPEYQNKTVDVKAIIQYLIEFLKHPVSKISQIPDWNLPSLFVIQISIAVLSGVIAGLIKLNIYRIANGLILMPIVSTISSLLLSTFLYYYFQFFENRTENFKKIFSLVIVASIPFYLFQVISEYFSPVTLVGFLFTSTLLVVGLNESFRMERQRTFKVVGFLFFIVFITWISNKLVP